MQFKDHVPERARTRSPGGLYVLHLLPLTEVMFCGPLSAAQWTPVDPFLLHLEMVEMSDCFPSALSGTFRFPKSVFKDVALLRRKVQPIELGKFIF